VRKASSDDPTHAVSPFRGGAVICHNNKVVMPLQLRTHVVNWCHKMSCHPGKRRAEETMRQHLTWPGLKTDVLKCIKMSKLPERQETKKETWTRAPNISRITTLGTFMR
jgi:hypothetical protein